MGYPDWQRYAQWVDTPTVITAEAVPVAGVVHGPYTVAQWAAVEVFWSTAVTNQRLTLEWFDTSALTTSMGVERYHSASPDSHEFRTINRGPVLRVTTIANVAGGTQTLVIVLSNRLLAHNVATAEAVLQAVRNQNVLAGATDFRAVTRYRGPAHLAFSTTAAAFVWDLQALDYLGNIVASLSAITNLPVRLEEVLHLPSYRIRWAFTNNDAVAQTYSAALVAIR